MTMRGALSIGSLFLAASAARGEDPVAEVDRAVARAAERAAPAVVALEVERGEPKAAEKKKPMPPMMPGGRLRSLLDYNTRPKGPVSGVIVEPDGLVLTSYYNVAGEVRSISVTVDGKAHPGTLVGWSELHDVALVRIDARGLPVLVPAPAGTAVPGRFCVLVGRSPVPSRPTIAWGVVSATRRWEETALQTDAEMNFGTSGGALVDLEGRLLGVASHIRDGTVWGQSSGVGFATKWEKIQEILPRLKAGEKMEQRIGYLGVAFDEEAFEEGARVLRVAPGSPAEKAGLRTGDLIIEFAEKPVQHFEQLIEDLRATPPGTKVKMKVRRGEEVREVEAELTNRPTSE
jgi:S1-C subfamily serine protease